MKRSKNVWLISLVKNSKHVVLYKLSPSKKGRLAKAVVRRPLGFHTPNFYYSKQSLYTVSFHRKNMISFAECLRSILAVIVILSLLLSMTNAQYPKKEKFQPVSEEVKFIRCETCQKAVKQLYRKTKELREVAPGKKVSTVNGNDYSTQIMRAHNILVIFCEQTRNCVLLFY